MPSTPTIDMTPQDLVDKNGNYVFQQDVIYSVLQYCWAGALLPDSASAFQERLQLSSSTMKKLKDVLENLIRQYSAIHEELESFKDVTYAHAIEISDGVDEYAKLAGGGGRVQESYYANILDCIRNLESPEDEKDRENLKAALKEIVELQDNKSQYVQEMIQAVLDDFKGFYEQLLKDTKAVQSAHAAVRTALKDDVGNLEELQKNLADDRASLQAEHAAHVHDKIVASSPLSYALVPVVGIIATSVVAGVTGTAAEKMASAVDKTKADITNDAGQITDAARLIGDIASIDADLISLLPAVAATIGALQDAKKTWVAISAELTKLEKMVDDDFQKALEFARSVEDAKLVAQWDGLAKAVEKYKKAAVINSIDETRSLEDLSTQLHKQAGSNGAE
ncbi:hypothetical protein GGG16DRAFT_102915 [Schizophyllum commune]